MLSAKHFHMRRHTISGSFSLTKLKLRGIPVSTVGPSKHCPFALFFRRSLAEKTHCGLPWTWTLTSHGLQRQHWHILQSNWDVTLMHLFSRPKTCQSKMMTSWWNIKLLNCVWSLKLACLGMSVGPLVPKRLQTKAWRLSHAPWDDGLQDIRHVRLLEPSVLARTRMSCSLCSKCSLTCMQPHHGRHSIRTRKYKAIQWSMILTQCRSSGMGLDPWESLISTLSGIMARMWRLQLCRSAMPVKEQSDTSALLFGSNQMRFSCNWHDIGRCCR